MAVSTSCSACALGHVIMHVAGRHQRQPRLPRQFHQPVELPPVVRPAVQLGQQIAAVAEQLAIEAEAEGEKSEAMVASCRRRLPTSRLSALPTAPVQSTPASKPVGVLGHVVAAQAGIGPFRRGGGRG